jgi:D-methionine transport system ATP-binding protein
MAVIKEICHRLAAMEAGRIIEHGDVFDVFTALDHPTRRSFVSSVVGAELPDTLVERLVVGPLPGGNSVLRITFKGALADMPIISQLTQRFGLHLNILHGRIDHTTFSKSLNNLAAIVSFGGYSRPPAKSASFYHLIGAEAGGSAHQE